MRKRDFFKLFSECGEFMKKTLPRSGISLYGAKVTHNKSSCDCKRIYYVLFAFAYICGFCAGVFN